ncbi:MAG: recombinase family protein [Alphaproteobacteria bacterium]
MAEKRGQKIKKRLDIDPLHAEIVRLIFDLYLIGDGQSGSLGLKAIVNRLNAQGYRTQAGAKFSCKFIHDILTRPAYTGTHTFNATEAKTKRQKPPEEVVAISIPTIIPKDQFEEVQIRLGERAPRVTAPRIVNGPCLLTGLATCATCGGDSARLEALRGAAREAELRVQRLYAAIENGVVDIADPSLRDRLNTLKIQRDETKRLSDLAEAPAMVLPTITDEMIERFAQNLRAKLHDGPIAMRKAYLQAIVERIEVDDTEIRIFGRKDKRLNQLMSDRPKPAGKVRSFGREWRPVGDAAPSSKIKHLRS